MARSMWKGAISFGLVHIPVEMYPAVEQQGTRPEHARPPRLLADRLQTLQQEQPARKSAGTTSSRATSTRRANTWCCPTKTCAARIRNRPRRSTSSPLSTPSEVPLIYYDQPYYLAPGKGGAKVYALLRDTLKKAGKIGIAHVVIRVKQHLAALHCVGDTIVMNTLRYPDEIRDDSELKIPAANAKDAVDQRQGTQDGDGPGAGHERGLEAEPVPATPTAKTCWP